MTQNATLWDRIVSITSYYTLGLTGLIWLIASYVIFKKPASPFCSYHIYQSIFIAVILAVFGMLFNIIFSFTAGFPFVGQFIRLLNLYIFKLPVFYTFTLYHFVVFVVLTYLSLGALLGKYSYFPFISDVIRSGFRY